MMFETPAQAIGTASAYALPPVWFAPSHEPKVTCAKCQLRETCLSGGTPPEDLERVEGIVYVRRSVKRGKCLFRAGDEFKSIYAIRNGFFKTTLADAEGREQVTGFFMSGELLGIDGLGNGYCESNAIALEDSEVCMMPYALIEKVARDVPSLQRRLHTVLAREIVRNHGIMLLLGSMNADERLATFLLNLSMRYARSGVSASDFVLRMKRDEIGSYLGLRLETVSRVFSSFQRGGMIEVQQREIRIVDSAALERVLSTGGVPTGGVPTGGIPLKQPC